MRVKLLVSSSFIRWCSIEMPWLRRCGAFLMVLMICRTLDDPCRRSKLDEFIPDDDCCGCGCKGITLLLLLSKIVGIAADAGWMKALLLPLLPPLLENRFNSLAVDGVPLFDERRLRNDNDFKRLSLVDSRLLGAGGDDCFCRSSNEDTNWSKTFKSAFILEFRMVLAVTALLSTMPALTPPPPFLFDGSPKRFVI